MVANNDKMGKHLIRTIACFSDWNWSIQGETLEQKVGDFEFGLDLLHNYLQEDTLVYVYFCNGLEPNSRFIIYFVTDKEVFIYNYKGIKYINITYTHDYPTFTELLKMPNAKDISKIFFKNILNNMSLQSYTIQYNDKFIQQLVAKILVWREGA